MSKPVLVIGGAGYIGSHTCLELAAQGFLPVVYDNLSNGHAEFVQYGPLETGDILDADRLVEVMERHRPVAIVHFAALIEVGQSVKDPLAFWRNNVTGSLCVIEAARRCGIDAIVFSSTCATYGEPQRIPMSEDHPQAPLSPYGDTKLAVERMLASADAAHGMRSVILRYFNAAGADPEGRLGEWHDPETHAIPLAIDAALGRRAGFAIFGSDYPTEDGTCVRDYVHVLDLADAHVRAVRYLIEGGASTAINLGTGTGTTVRQLLEAVRRISGHDFEIRNEAARDGDSPKLVADNGKARDVLGWQPQRDLDEIVRSAWNWHSRRNAG